MGRGGDESAVGSGVQAPPPIPPASTNTAWPALIPREEFDMAMERHGSPRLALDGQEQDFHRQLLLL